MKVAIQIGKIQMVIDSGVDNINEVGMVLRFENVRELEVHILKLQQARGIILGVREDVFEGQEDISKLYESNTVAEPIEILNNLEDYEKI